MHITSVELENIKSHANSRYEFARGSTAITGENGAGKTTIIEAISWALFDVLDYKKDDFVRRGAKKGSVRVTFESSMDEREYAVYRDTGTGYYAYDPRLEMRVADKKEEVTRFLWQHLGVEPGTDLESLFKQAIGVPQGTFTAVFLATPAERKKTFDALLKVEEYQRGSQELLKTSRFIDGQIGAVDVKIARAEGEIARTDAVAAEHIEVSERSAELKRLIDVIVSQLNEKTEVIGSLDETESRLAGALAVVEKLRSEKARSELVLSQRKTDLNRSREAAELIEKVKADAERHISMLGQVKELERERSEREKLQLELSKVEAAILSVSTEKEHLQKELDRLQASHKEIESLKKLVAEQERLETEAEKTRNEVADAEAAEKQSKAHEEKLERLRESYKSNQTQLKEARSKCSAADGLEKLQIRDSELVRELAALRASLERDEAFQREIKNGLCPILSEKCLNLKEGQTLESFVTSQFGDLRLKIETLTREQHDTALALRTSREAEKFLSQIPVLESREREIKEEGERLKEEKAVFDRVVKSLPDLRSRMKSVEADLKALDNPKTKIALLEKEVAREPDIRDHISNSEKNLERLESDRRLTTEKFESYKDLDAHWNEAVSVRDATSESYRIFIASEAEAKQIVENEKAFEQAKAELADIVENLQQAEAAFESAGKGYDRELHLSERKELIVLQRREAELKAMFEASKKREDELARELARLNEIKRSMKQEFHERGRLEKIAEVTDFIRTTLKEAAPLVARNYVYHVSVEAAQMFREITGNAERTLKWSEEYGIILEEGGHERPFQSLSGGEQMAAALSVRLALLKQLSDIRIAFFDEPTTNMDAERRENLAMQIGNIRHFDQLFVISHDDTFDSYMDHEISIGE